MHHIHHNNFHTYPTIISNIQKSLGKSSGWIIDSVIEHNINISKYNPLAASSYTKLPKELDHSKKGLINIQNIGGNECFKWCLIRYLNPADHQPARTAKAGKGFSKIFNFKYLQFPVKAKDFHKIEKNIQSALAFLLVKVRKNIQFMYEKVL